MIVDPWGVVLAQAPDREAASSPTSTSSARREVRRELPVARQPPAGGLPLAGASCAPDGHDRALAAVDKRRMILDAAVRVFARQGFHACRVSDIADEAGVAYGLVYHYFRSKDEVLDTLFLERWNVLLEAIAEIDRARDPRARQAPRDRRRSSWTPTATTPT